MVGTLTLCPPYNFFSTVKKHSVSSPGLTGRSSIPEASEFIREASGILDAPHARGMTAEDTLAHSRSMPCPGDASSLSLETGGRRECRECDAPAALRANGKSTQASHHRYAATPRHSLRNGFTVYGVLSSECRAR